MPATLEGPVQVEVWDPTGQYSAEMAGVAAETPVAEVIGLSKAQMTLPPNVPWLLRDNSTARLLRGDQPVGEVAREGKVDLTLQPDASLG